MSDIIDVNLWKRKFDDFATARDFEQFHNPKNLAMALSVESSELLEIFQWLTFEQAEKLKEKSDVKEHLSEELADILLYAIRLSDRLEINLSDALEMKMRKNEEKYSLEFSRKIVHQFQDE